MPGCSTAQLPGAGCITLNGKGTGFHNPAIMDFAIYEDLKLMYDKRWSRNRVHF